MVSRTLKCAQIAVILALCLLVPACKSKVTQANYDKITEGMTLSEVEKILGKGTKDEGGDGSNVAAQFGVDVTGGAGPAAKTPGETYTWEGGKATVTVYLRQGKVVRKQTSGF
jgi:hypothetical protein